jgi:inorganic pyrophosphatase/exopolyphosphatase
LLSNVLSSFGIECYPCILSQEYNLDTYNGKIIEDFFEYNPVLINTNDINKYNFILVDHNDPKQSIGINSNVIFGIDHHKDSGTFKNILISDYSSTSLFIYDYFKEKATEGSHMNAVTIMQILVDDIINGRVNIN